MVEARIRLSPLSSVYYLFLFFFLLLTDEVVWRGVTMGVVVEGSDKISQTSIIYMRFFPVFGAKQGEKCESS